MAEDRVGDEVVDEIGCSYEDFEQLVQQFADYFKLVNNRTSAAGLPEQTTVRAMLAATSAVVVAGFGPRHAAEVLAAMAADIVGEAEGLRGNLGTPYFGDDGDGPVKH